MLMNDNDRNSQYGNQPNQGVQGAMTNNMYPQAVQDMGMPNQMNYNGVQGAHQPMDMNDNIKQLCKNYMNYHVQAKMKDGSEFEGIITDMDENNVTMLVPEEVDEDSLNDMSNRQYGYGYGGYGRRRYRRYNRRVFPLFYFGFPFFRPYPHYY